MLNRLAMILGLVLFALDAVAAGTISNADIPPEVVQEARFGFQYFMTEVRKDEAGFRHSWDVEDCTVDLSKIMLDEHYVAYLLNEDQMLAYLHDTTTTEILDYATVLNYVFSVLMNDTHIATLRVTKNERWDGTKIRENACDYAFFGYSNGSDSVVQQALQLRRSGYIIAIVCTPRWLGDFFIAKSQDGSQSVLPADKESHSIILASHCNKLHGTLPMAQVTPLFKAKLQKRFDIIKTLYEIPDSTTMISDFAGEIYSSNPYPSYEFRGVDINGNPPVDHFDQIIIALKDVMEPDEKLLRISAANWRYGIVYATTQNSFAGCRAGHGIKIEWDGSHWIAHIESRWTE